jgi:uncharacterized protein YndB with AHSA1/START domain
MADVKRTGPRKTSRELTLTRIIGAPRERVFRAWTEETGMAKWWGPLWFSNPVCLLDARPGGKIRIDMKGPDGVVYPMGGMFLEVARPARLVFTSTAMQDADGKPQLTARNTITLEDFNGMTKQTLHVVVTNATQKAEAALEGMEQGWSESMVKLAQYLAQK